MRAAFREAAVGMDKEGEVLRSMVRIAVQRCFGSVIRPTRLRTGLKVIRNLPRSLDDYLYDLVRYFRHSSTFYYPDRDNRMSRITAMYHSVERGLALPEPQSGFGAQNIAYLVEAIEEYLDRFGEDARLSAPAGALDAYLAFNRSRGVDPPNRLAIERVLERLQPLRAEHRDGGTIDLMRETVAAATKGFTPDFFFMRHSIRQFSQKEVDPQMVDAAIAMAQKSPAVCNRQECRVYIAREKTLMEKMLAIQESRGFNHQIDTLLLVSNRLSAYYGTNERNQCWVDGGLFAMSLVLALHGQGLGTCFLNWSKSAPRDKAMRKLLGLPREDVIITLVAVGHIPARLSVARSVRLPLEAARVRL